MMGLSHSSTMTIHEDSNYSKKSKLINRILKHPETDVGRIQPVTENLWLFEKNHLTRREATYVLGFCKMFDEILVNTGDGIDRDPPTRTLAVEINETDGLISICHDGMAIPITQQYIEEEEMVYWMPEFIFADLPNNARPNPLGAKLTNICSTKFIVNTFNINNNAESPLSAHRADSRRS
jgi:DNA topoisomerase-2